MSEDVLHLNFKMSGADKPPKDFQERLAKLVYRKQPGELSSADRKGVRTLSFGMCDVLNDGVVKQMLALAVAQGGGEAMASVHSDQTGEECWYALAQGELVRADTEKALKRTLAEKHNTGATLNVFGKFESDEPAGKAVIKLQSANDDAAKSLEQMFSMLLDRSEDAYAAFCVEFAKRCGEKKQRIKLLTEWCRFQPSHHIDRWFDGPSEIARHVSFVVRADLDLYVGMDLRSMTEGSGKRKLSEYDRFRMDDRLGNLLFVLAQLNGVKKCWIRFQFSDDYFAGAWPVAQLDVPCVVDIGYGRSRPEYEW